MLVTGRKAQKAPQCLNASLVHKADQRMLKAFQSDLDLKLEHKL